jgi:hypothetical protein
MTHSSPRIARALFALPLLLGLASAQSAAQAASLQLMPAVSAVQVGTTFQLALWLDFSDDPTLGGGIDVFYDDTLLDFIGFEFDATLGDDLAFRRLPDVQAGELNGLAFGDFNGLSGPARVGQFSFQALAEGEVTLGMAANDAPAGGFFSAVTFSAQSPQFIGAAVQVSAIPEPASYALFLMGLGGLMTWLRRRRAVLGGTFGSPLAVAPA